MGNIKIQVEVNGGDYCIEQGWMEEIGGDNLTTCAMALTIVSRKIMAAVREGYTKDQSDATLTETDSLTGCTVPGCEGDH